MEHRSRKEKIGRGNGTCGQTTKGTAKGETSMVFMNKSTGIQL